MDGLTLLLLGAVLGLVVVLLRPQTLVVPTIVATPDERGGGCLGPLGLLLLLLVMGLLLFGGKPL